MTDREQRAWGVITCVMSKMISIILYSKHGWTCHLNIKKHTCSMWTSTLFTQFSWCTLRAVGSTIQKGKPLLSVPFTGLER